MNFINVPLSILCCYKVATKKLSTCTGHEHDDKRVPLLMVIAWCSVNDIMKVQRKLIFWKYSLLLKIKLTNYTHGSDKEDWVVPNCATFFYYFFFNS